MVEKKKNFIAAYFTPFGLKQICDIILLIGAVLLIVGMCVSLSTLVVALIGTIFMAVGSFIVVCRMTYTMTHVNKKTSRFKNALVNLILMSIFFAVSLFLAIFIGVSML